MMRTHEAEQPDTCLGQFKFLGDVQLLYAKMRKAK